MKMRIHSAERGNSCATSRGFGPWNPEGMVENSPNFQVWVNAQGDFIVPKGRLKARITLSAYMGSAVPSGLISCVVVGPNLERLGYCRSIPPGWKPRNPG